jgi:hypothetical protein
MRRPRSPAANVVARCSRLANEEWRIMKLHLLCSFDGEYLGDFHRSGEQDLGEGVRGRASFWRFLGTRNRAPVRSHL